MSSVWKPEQAWRRRADLNSLGLAVLLVLMAFLFWKAVDTTQRVQQSRVEVTRTNCLAQNNRHDATVRKLDQLIADIPPGARRRRAERGRASTVALIDALAPKRDCKAVVDQVRAATD